MLFSESPVTHLSCSGAEPPTPGQTLSTLSRLLRQAEICFRPILYDARDSHRAFGDFLRGKIEMHRSQPLINFAWSLTTEQPVLRARSSQNVRLLTYPVKENIQDVI
jgi:hypothetical protein